jgi:hypothetical protein
MRSREFLIDLILPAVLCPWGRLILLTEMSARKLLGSKGRPERKADYLTAICERIVYKMWKPRYLTTLWAFMACYRDMSNTHKYSIINPLLYKLHYTTHIQVKYYQHSQNRHDTLKPKPAHSFVTRYII